MRIVINHCGGVGTDGGDPDPAWLGAMAQAAEQPQVFMKVSAIMEQSRVDPAPEELDFYRPILDAMWDAFGADRVIYGSNWPVSDRAGSFKAAISIVKAYFGEKGVAEKYLWENGKIAYKWLDR